MPNVEEIKSLIARMPELDSPPPEPKPDPKPADPAQPIDPKAAPPKPKPKGEQFAGKGKLTGPTWASAETIYDAILGGGKESVSMVIDQITENDIGPAYKPRYVLHGMAVYACREGKEKERATIIAAIFPELSGNKPKSTRGFLIRTLQVCADETVIPNLAPLLADAELADAAAQAMVTLSTLIRQPKSAEASRILRDALPTSTGRPRLAIIQALGALKDATALDALAQAAGDADENTRITALWSLARSGDAKAIEPILKAAEAPDGWPRTQAVKAAFLLAESFVAANQKENAVKIYQYLQQSRTADHELFVQEAAVRGLAGLR